MSHKITSVTYRRYRSRTILTTGRFVRVETAKTAGGLRETLCPEMAFASAAGRLLASGTSSAHGRFRQHFSMVGGRNFERADSAPGTNAERNPAPLMPRRYAMHPRPAKSRSGLGLDSKHRASEFESKFESKPESKPGPNISRQHRLHLLHSGGTGCRSGSRQELQRR